MVDAMYSARSPGVVSTVDPNGDGAGLSGLRGGSLAGVRVRDIVLHALPFQRNHALPFPRNFGVPQWVLPECSWVGESARLCSCVASRPLLMGGRRRLCVLGCEQPCSTLTMPSERPIVRSHSPKPTVNLPRHHVTDWRPKCSRRSTRGRVRSGNSAPINSTLPEVSGRCSSCVKQHAERGLNG